MWCISIGVSGSLRNMAVDSEEDLNKFMKEFRRKIDGIWQPWGHGNYDNSAVFYAQYKAPNHAMVTISWWEVKTQTAKELMYQLARIGDLFNPRWTSISSSKPKLTAV